MNVIYTRRFIRIRDPVVPYQIQDAVTRLNVLIHRYESVGISTNHGHIDVLFVPVKRRDFANEDYQFFSCDNHYGGLYLAGGILPGILDFLQQSTFVQRFQEKGKMREHLARVPLYIITCETTGLLGAAHAPLS